MAKPSVVVRGCFLLLFQGILTIQLRYYTECYGNTGLQNLQPSCAIREKIAVVGVYAFAKKLSTSCPTEVTILNAAGTPDSCCQYDSDDCYIFYVGSTYRSYYQLCNGNAYCDIQVAAVTTTCNQFVYLASTNYMSIYYYCISDQGLDPCTNLNTKDSVVFLWNSAYPLPLSGTSTCTCSVEASCASRIRLKAIDLRLGTTTSCDQSITITDGSTVMVFDCSDNNDYLPTTLYTSTSHFIQIQVVDNLWWSIDGYYFILLEGISSGAELTLSCGSTARNTPTVPFTSLPDCHSTDATTVSTTTPIVTTVSTTTSIVTTDSKTTIIVTTDSTTTPIVTRVSTTTPIVTTDSQTTPIVTSDSTTMSIVTTDIQTKPIVTTDSTTTSIVTTDSTTTPIVTTTKQNLASSGFTSAEKDTIVNGTVTTISSVSESLMETSSIVSRQTTETNMRVNEEQPFLSSSVFLIIGVTTATILTCGLVISLMFFRYKTKGNCGKKKVSSIIDEGDIANIPDQIPPINHCFTERHQRTLDRNDHQQI